MRPDARDDVVVAVGFTDQVVTVRVGGEVDLLTAPTLGCVLGGLIDDGRPKLVVDLEDLGFLDAAGLGVLADVTARLQATNRRLTLRSPPVMLRRLLEITHMLGLVDIEVTDAAPRLLGAEGATGLLLPAGRGRGEVPDASDPELAPRGSAHRQSVLIAALGFVTALADATVDGADGVSVSLERDGRITTVASTNETVRRMDDHQYETGQGPCLAAAAEGHWFHVDALETERRWPDFVPLALGEGIGSILSTPLMAAERPVGALNIYSNTEGAFGPTEQRTAALLATQASTLLDGEATMVTGARVGDPLLRALTARAVIARAQGVLMACQEVSATDADSIIHRTARDAGISVLQRATDIVAATRPTPPVADQEAT